MTNSAKLKYLGAGVVLCLAIIAGIGYSSWVLFGKVERLEGRQVLTNNPVTPKLSQLSKNGIQWNDAWDKFGDISQNFAQMNRFMDDMVSNMLKGHSAFDQSNLGIFQQDPTIKFEENDDEYQVTVEMRKGDDAKISTEISDGIFSVSGKINRTASNGQFSQSQFSSEFSRSFMLDKPVDQAAMEVVNDKGKTIIHIPKLIG